MNLSITELEALHLGMAIVAQAADPELQRAAVSLARKIDKVATAKGTKPKRWGFGVYPFAQAKLGFKHMPVIRNATRAQQKLKIDYLSLDNQTSTRTVWPLQIEFWGQVWTLTTWCETRIDFRGFQVDHMTTCLRLSPRVSVMRTTSGLNSAV